MNDYVLIYYPSEGGEQRFELENDRTYRLGSQESNDCVVPQNDVSRNHAILRVSGGSFHITDLKSKNGTFVNGNRTASARFRCGDLINLSSARFVVVEAGSGDYSAGSGDMVKASDHRQSTSDTVQRRIRASSEDLIALLEMTAKAVKKGALAVPLTWGVSRLDLAAAVVLYRNSDDLVSIVSSAGDLGPLIERSESLGEVARDPKLDLGGHPQIRHFHEVGEDILLAPLCDRHLLIIRYSGSPPPVGDIQALASATELVLNSVLSAGGTESHPLPAVAPSTRSSFNPESVVGMSLKEARREFERWLIARTLEDCDGNQSMASRKLAMSRAGFFKKARKLGV